MVNSNVCIQDIKFHTCRYYFTSLLVYRNYHNFQNLSWSDFQLKLENKGGVEFFKRQEVFQKAGQIFTPG